MKELFKSIVFGIPVGILVYLILLFLHCNDAIFFGIMVAFSLSGARFFSPQKKLIKGIKSLCLIDYVGITILSSGMFCMASMEKNITRLVIAMCYGLFFLAMAISVRNPIYLFRNKNRC